MHPPQENRELAAFLELGVTPSSQQRELGFVDKSGVYIQTRDRDGKDLTKGEVDIWERSPDLL